MAILNAAQRKALPMSSFAVPSRAPGPGSYPVPDAAHVQAAMGRAKQFGSPGVQAAVKGKVAKRFPGIGKGKNRRFNSAAEIDAAANMPGRRIML